MHPTAIDLYDLSPCWPMVLHYMTSVAEASIHKWDNPRLTGARLIARVVTSSNCDNHSWVSLIKIKAVISMTQAGILYYCSVGWTAIWRRKWRGGRGGGKHFLFNRFMAANYLSRVEKVHRQVELFPEASVLFQYLAQLFIHLCHVILI